MGLLEIPAHTTERKRSQDCSELIAELKRAAMDQLIAVPLNLLMYGKTPRRRAADEVHGEQKRR